MSKYVNFGYGAMRLTNVEGKLNAESGLLSKPEGECVWASAVDAYIPWSRIATPDFLPAPHRMTQAIIEKSYIEFDVDDSKIYHIRTLEDILKYCLNVHSVEDFEEKRYSITYFAIDFDGLREDGYAGCEYHYSEDEEYLNHNLFWDCDSIVIWDKSVISNITYAPTHKQEYTPNASLYPADALDSEEYYEYDEELEAYGY